MSYNFRIHETNTTLKTARNIQLLYIMLNPINMFYLFIKTWAFI